LTVGVVGFQAALGRGGDTTDPGGALVRLLGAPLGRGVVALLAIGLAGYAVWRLLQAILDSEHKGTEPQGLVRRMGFGISAASYASLAVSAVGMALHRSRQPNGDQATRDRTAWRMSRPFGRWLVTAVGLVVLGVAAAQVVQAYRASFEGKIREHELGRRTRAGTRRGARGLSGTRACVRAHRRVPGGGRMAGEPRPGARTPRCADDAREPAAGAVTPGRLAIGPIGYGLHLLVSARYREMVLT
jgi:hypothetical protein